MPGVKAKTEACTMFAACTSGIPNSVLDQQVELRLAAVGGIGHQGKALARLCCCGYLVVHAAHFSYGSVAAYRACDREIAAQLPVAERGYRQQGQCGSAARPADISVQVLYGVSKIVTFEIEPKIVRRVLRCGLRRLQRVGPDRRRPETVTLPMPLLTVRFIVTNEPVLLGMTATDDMDAVPTVYALAQPTAIIETSIATRRYFPIIVSSHLFLN